MCGYSAAMPAAGDVALEAVLEVPADVDGRMTVRPMNTAIAGLTIMINPATRWSARAVILDRR